MKYIAKYHIISMIGLLVSHFIFAFIAIMIKSKLLAVIAIIGLVILGWYLFDKMLEWYPKNLKKLSNDKFHELKSKENPTLFEILYVKAYNDLAIDILENIINENRIKHAHSLDFESSYKEKFITFTFNHKRHSVYYHIYEDKVLYFIDSPEKYDNLEINKEYEKVRIIKININKYNSLDDFFIELIPSIEENIKSIDDFEENVSVTKNSKTLEEIEDYRDYFKQMSIFLNILSIIIMGMTAVISYFAILDLIELFKESIIRAIFAGLTVLLIDFFGVAVFIHSIYVMIYCKIISNDIKKDRTETIKAKPYKVKVLVTSIGYRHNVTKFCCGIKLYFKNEKKIKLVFAHYFDVPSNKSKEKIKNEFMKKNLELKYYKNSKMIVQGLESYRKIIKKHSK